MSLNPQPAVHEIQPGEGYDIDSDEFESEDEGDMIPDDEYDQLMEEAENGFTEEEMHQMAATLKEVGLVTFLRDYLRGGDGDEIPSLRKLILGFGIIPPISLRDPSTPNLALLPFTKLALSRILRRRQKLPQYNTIEDAIHLLKTRKNIIVLTGAGISTSCGIPDFRSSEGLYAKLQEEGRFDLDDPQQMFDIGYFREHPEVFYSFAKQIYPSNFTPSPCHRWIKLLEDKGLLLRNYTQNIDTLESQAGVQKVLQCHGSFKTASCLRCKTRVPGSTIEPNIMSQTIPYCPICRKTRDAELEVLKSKPKSKGKAKAQWGSESEDEENEWGGGEPGIMKPDITFFGQALDFEFDECLFKDREKVDLLVVIGTSLKVAPVSEVLAHIPHSVPQIYINMTPVLHVKPDICLLGDADTIVTYLSERLGWTIPPPTPVKTEIDKPGSSLENQETVCLSGVGEMSHMHFISKREKVKPEAIESSPIPTPEAIKGDSRSSIIPGSIEMKEADGGVPVDRPSKRVKV